MADRTRSVVVALGANITGYAAAIRAAKDTTVDFTKSAIGYAQQHQAELNELAGSAARLGVGLVAVSGFAVKSAMDWETAWTGVLKTVDGTAAELAQLEDELRELATTTGFAHTEVAAVAEAAGQLGVKTGDIAAFTETMLALGVSTNLSADEAATAIAQMANVMGTSAGDIDNLASTLVALGNDGASTEAQIIQMAQRIAGAANTVGMSEAEVLAFANTVASLGIEVEAGGTAVSTVISTMARETAQGGAKLEAFAKTAGMSAAQFTAAFKSEPTAAIQAFIEGLGRLQEEGGNVYGVLQDVGLSDVRVSQALIGMASASDLLADSLATGDEAWQQNIALMAEAEKFYDTTAQKGKQSWAQVKDAAIDAGEGLLPVVSQIFDAVSAVADAFGSLPEPVQSGVTTLAAISGVALLAVAGLTRLVTSIAATKTALAALSVSGGTFAPMIAGIARGLGAAAIGFAAFAAGATAIDKLDERNAKEISDLAGELQKLGESGKAAGTIKDLFGEDLSGRARRFNYDMKSLGEAVAQFGSYGDDNSLTENLKFLTSAGTSAGLSRQAEGIRDLDRALVELSRNSPDDAITAFERLRDTALQTGASADDLAVAFPSMTEILRSASESIGGTSDATALLNGELSELGPAAQASAEQLAATQEAVSSAGGSFRDLSAEVDGNTMSFEQWLRQLEEQQVAQSAWADNMAAIAERGAPREILDELIELGSEGAVQAQWLANASEAEFARYVAAAEGPKTKTQELIDTINRIYSPAPINVTTAGIPEAIAQLGNLLDAVAGVPGGFGVLVNAKPAPAKSIRAISEGRATGGPITGPGGPTEDLVPFWGSNGEHVLRAAEVDAMGGHAGVYAFRSALMSGQSAFSSKPQSYTAQAATFGVPASIAAAPAKVDLTGMQLQISGQLDLVNGQPYITGIATAVVDDRLTQQARDARGSRQSTSAVRGRS